MPRWTRSATLWLCVLSLGFTIFAMRKGLAAAGALTLPQLWDGEYWRVLTTTFIHAGWMHLGFNALSLYLLGARLGIERDIGRGLYVASVLLGSAAGLAASFFWAAGDMPRVGISGGILALVGLLLAEEWQHTKSFKRFLRSRNTIVILIVLVLNAGIAWWFERNNPNVKVDHAGHIGGLVFGLVAGLALFSVPGKPKTGVERKTVLRVRRGLVVALVVGLVPIGYVAFPWWDPQFFRQRGVRLLVDDKGEVVSDRTQRDKAAFYLGRAQELDPGHPVSGAGLAIVRDDPRYLEGLRTGRPSESAFVLAAYLELARARLVTAPAVAMSLAETASAIRPASAQAWFDFATKAAGARQDELATLARMTALNVSDRGQLSIEQRFRAAQGVLPAIEQRFRTLHVTKEDPIRLCLDAARVLRYLAPALNEEAGLGEREADALETWIVRMLRRIRVAHTGATAPAQVLAKLRREMAQLYDHIAGETRVAEREAGHVFQSARWLLLAAQADGTVAQEALVIAKRALGALQLAQTQGDTATADVIAAWLAEHRADLGSANGGD